MSELIGNAGLTGIVLIDIGIGIIFAILTFSLIASALQEAFAGVLNYRGEHLRKGILRLIDGTHKPQNKGDSLKTLGRAVLDHAAIRGLKGPKNWVQWFLYNFLILGDGAKDEDRMPSSIPRNTFAKALVESLVDHKKVLEAAVAEGGARLDEKRDTIEKVIDGLAISNRLKARLKAIVDVDFSELAEDVTDAIDETLDAAQQAALAARRKAVAAVNAEIAALEDELAQWFDDTMDRVTGWYVRRAKTMLFAIGFVMASAIGFDIIGYGQQLARDEALRSSIVAEASVAVATGKVGSFEINTGNLNDRAQAARDKKNAGLELTEEDQRALDAVAAFSAKNDPDPDNISPEEAEAAKKTLSAAVDVVNSTAADAINTINQTFAERGVTLSTPIWTLWGDWIAVIQLLLSAGIIGLGCTLGGQFWFDLLKTFLKVRAGASGLTTDREKRTA